MIRLSSRKAPIDKVPVLQVQHQVPNQFETPLVESEEDPASPQEILRESLELLVRSQVTSSPGDANNLLGTHNDRLSKLCEYFASCSGCCWSDCPLEVLYNFSCSSAWHSERCDLFVLTFSETSLWILTLGSVSDFHTYNSDSTFSSGGDDEGSAAANSVMPALENGDRRKQTHQSQMPLYSQLEGTGSSVSTVKGSAEASRMVRHQQIEADPSLVPLAPHQKLNGISMARN
ncbi:hypothetical protein Tco_0493760 [Tanacetum coccineum]